MAKERLFWTGSVNIIGDPRPSGLDMRVYACVSLHDGMSLLKGSGRGCYATFETLTARLGCDRANLSRSLRRLVDWGYLSEERQEDDRRRKTFRVVFEGGESWRNRQQSSGGKLAELPTIDLEQLAKLPTNRPEMVGNAESSNLGKQSEIDEHYSSLKELDSSEEDELNSEESARLAARDMLQVDFKLSDSANLAILERAMKRDAPIDLVEWFAFLSIALDRAEVQFINQVFRVTDDLAGLMTECELEEARARIPEMASGLAKQGGNAQAIGSDFADIVLNEHERRATERPSP